MTDPINKPKLQLRSVGSFNGDKTPSPSTKLLINHGKPNFTIPRVHKSNGTNDSFSSQSNNNFYAYKSANSSLKPTTMGTFQGNGSINNSANIISSTKLNGAFKPANVRVAPPNDMTNDNEAAKVVLRHIKVPETANKGDEDENVPEFIRRQRRIQERLAKENVLDFEKRRSGYFTQVLISPTTPNRTSFVETMASPAMMPSLEMPPPLPESRAPETLPEEPTEASTEPEARIEETVPVAPQVDVQPFNSDSDNQVDKQQQQQQQQQEQVDEEEEVAKAIEEVNKAVAGEESPDEADATPGETEFESIQTTRAELAEDEPHTQPLLNGHNEPVLANGSQEDDHKYTETVTISHANALNGPSIPAPDPSGALGVNYEPKTVVSFSKDLGSEPNKYPDTVKVIKSAETESAADAELQEMAKLKFDIKANEQDVQVTPILRAD